MPLALLRHAAFPALKLTHKILFVVLWNWAGCRPGGVSGSCSAIAAELGVADRRVREWVPKLAEAGLVVIVDWTREGALTVEVNDPAEVARGRVRQPDPQGTLFDDDEPNEAEPPAAFSVPFPPAESVPKTPTPSRDAAPRASTVRPSDRPTEKWEIDWEEAHQFAVQLARWVPVKRKAAFADGRLLLFAAALTQGGVSEIAVQNALNGIKSQTPRNAAALFRVCLGEEVAKLMGTPLRTCREALSALERETRIPDHQVRALLAHLGRLKAHSEDAPCKPLSEATPEEREEARAAIAHAKAELEKGKTEGNNGSGASD